MYPLRLANAPQRAHVPQVGNPCYRRIIAKDWSEWRWALSFYGVENWLFLRIMCGRKRLDPFFRLHEASEVTFVQTRFLSCCFLLVRYGIKARLARTVTKTSGVASPKILVGGQMFDCRRIILFCLEKRLSKHKMTIFSKNLGGSTAPLAPPGYAFGQDCRYSMEQNTNCL